MADSISFIVANKKKSNANVDGIKYFPDCTVSISHTFDNEVTEHAIENGASFSDHSQRKNNKFSVSGVYNTKSLNVYTGDNISQDNRIPDAYSFLVNLRESRSRFTLVSKYASYPNCTITSLRFPVAPTDGNTLLFEMDISQIRLSSLEQVNIVVVDNVTDSKKDDAAATSNNGRTPTQVQNSLLKDVFSDLKGAGNLAEVTRGVVNGTP
jgi:hypothetical protein